MSRYFLKCFSGIQKYSDFCYIQAMNFWSKLNKPLTVLAPMANVTDWAFRQIIIKTGRPDVFFTEFISADGICRVGKEKFRGELYFEAVEKPIVVQFFSSSPENMYKCAQLAVELGFDGVDINMGCPDSSVEKQGAGAALIKNPDLAKKIISETIRGAGKIPVSVKTRLGFSKIEPDWIKNLLDTDIASLSVHARTRKEMSKVPAHWDELGKIAEMAKGSGKIIIGNGDVIDMDDLKQKADKFGLDGIMVGRGIFQNPWFFSDRKVEDPKERINLLMEHVNNFEKLWSRGGSGKNFDVLKRFFKIYISNWPGAKELRTKLMSAKSFKDVDEILKENVL